LAIYVDNLEEWGWLLRGRRVASCHMFTDELDLTNLHAMAGQIGMKRSWFQDKTTAPHYDLVKSRRDAAVALGAIPVGRHRAVAIWKARRELVAKENT
jgi:hypothetical protein